MYAHSSESNQAPDSRYPTLSNFINDGTLNLLLTHKCPEAQNETGVHMLDLPAEVSETHAQGERSYEITSYPAELTCDWWGGTEEVEKADIDEAFKEFIQITSRYPIPSQGSLAYGDLA